MYRTHNLKFLQRDKVAEKLNCVTKTVPLNDRYCYTQKYQSTNFIRIDIKCTPDNDCKYMYIQRANLCTPN